MEDKVLTEKESLDLISQMIRNTRSRLEDNSGIPFLIWGYTTVIVAVIVHSEVLPRQFDCFFLENPIPLKPHYLLPI